MKFVLFPAGSCRALLRWPKDFSLNLHDTEYKEKHQIITSVAQFSQYPYIILLRYIVVYHKIFMMT